MRYELFISTFDTERSEERINWIHEPTHTAVLSWLLDCNEYWDKRPEWHHKPISYVMLLDKEKRGEESVVVHITLR